MDAQIHELGNSIAAITHQNIGDKNAKDKDSGYALVSCVLDKLNHLP